MLKRIIVTILIAVVLAGCGGKKPIPASRLQQPAGQFSYITPDGWSRTKLMGIDFIVVFADPDLGMSPNIFVDYVEASAQVDTEVAELIQMNTDNHQAYEVVHQSDFITESGLIGVKISAGRENMDALPLATYHYVIQDADRVIVITCTCADTVKQKYEPIFDAAMKSLQSERKGHR
jgi:hypothetical protein